MTSFPAGHRAEESLRRVLNGAFYVGSFPHKSRRVRILLLICEAYAKALATRRPLGKAALPTGHITCGVIVVFVQVTADMFG